ncbi:Heat shock factor protein [Gryllus bimaculatus]|nr:Heat shock factor protein [Gryllus bimaculatus]
MHSVEELGTNVPAFLAKLWKMVEDSETNDLICWSPSGTSFYIRDQAKFARELLPLYYKHNNMASFVRQLNMYGFHKVVSIESGGLKIDRDDMEFAHQYFLMGHPYLLEHIKRKIPTNKSDDGRTGTKPELVNKVLSEVKSLKGRQDSVDSQLSAMKRANEVLWREVAILRQKHHKQQQIVNKLIQFLVSMVQTSRSGGIGIKRHYPLMLNDITHHTSKTSSKLNGNITDVNSSNMSPTGPVIHELDTAELLDDCSPAIDDENSAPVFDLQDAVNVGTSSSSDQSATTSATSTTSASNATRVAADSAGAADLSATNGTDMTGQPSQVLLELAEECPVNEDGLVTSGNMSISPLFSTVKPNKGKQRSSVYKGGKRRKSKLMPSIAKSTNPLVTIKTERMDPEEPVNVNNFLEIMLPSLVNDEANNSERLQASGMSGSMEGEVILPDLEESMESERDQQSSLEAATDAAISAISNVAARAAAQAASATGSKVQSDTSKASNSVGEKSSCEADDESGSSSKDLTLACAGSGDNALMKEDLDVHLENMQTDLDSLKELLKGEGYVDANMLLGVCAAGLGIDANTVKLFGDDPLSFGLPIVQDQNNENNGKQNGVSDPMVSGSELMACSSNLLDLADMSELDDWSLPAGSGSFTEESDDVLNTPLVTISSPGFSGAPTGKKRKTK